MNIIQGVGGNAFDALVYPEQSASHGSYFQNQIQSFSSTLNDVGRQFMESAREVYDRINNSEAMQLARVAIRAAKGIFHANSICELNTIEDFRSAQPVMQRWVMACPEIRELHQQQRCDGFSDTYFDAFPNVLGENHYDYRRVMDGVVCEDEDSWYARFYPDELVEGDRELLNDEKIQIINTWDKARIFIETKRDPTSPFGGLL